jgi:hypothetical protein
MFTQVSFKDCITENLKGRRFSQKRIKDILEVYEGKYEYYKSIGKPDVDAGVFAMKDTFDNLSDTAAEKAKRTAAMLGKQAEFNTHVKSALDTDMKLFDSADKKSSRGEAMAMSAVSMLYKDPRFKNIAYGQRFELTHGELWKIMDSVVLHAGKGALGRQRGKAHLPNIVREIRGEDTGDAAAKDMAKAFTKMQDVAVDIFNAGGGSMRKLADYFPQIHNGARILKEGEKAYVDLHLREDIVDWERTRWPDGSPIDPAERASVMKEIFLTKTTDGANKIDPKSFRGKGKALGNALDEHRFLHYKSADAWLEVHQKYGDGSVFDVMAQYVETMAHKIAMVESFGPSPDMGAANLRAVVMSEAAKLGGVEKAKAEALLTRKFDPMFETVARQNPMNPHSRGAAFAVGASNVLRAALLAKATLTALPSDMFQTGTVRAFNKMPVFKGMDFYIKSLATDRRFAERITTQSGFIQDDFVASTYNTMRYNGTATYGPNVTRRISDAVMRATLMSAHTRSLRGANQKEFMGWLADSMDKKLEELPFDRVFSRYGISPAEWDAVRAALKAWEPRKGVKLMRPIDILETNLPDKRNLFYKFQGMIHQESLHMVPDSTVEASVSLRGTTRPDTLHGLILYSFSAYKNFPITIINTNARLGMTSKNAKGRMGFYVGVLAAMTLSGILASQMKEIQAGRDPLPLDDSRVWAKGLATGGGLSIFGDFLFAGVDMFGRGPEDVAAGPLIGLLGDTTDLAFGDTHRLWKSMETGSDFDFQADEKLVRYAKRYNPVTNIWWMQPIVNRLFWDRMEEMVDPKIYSKRNSRKRKQQEEYGTGVWWPESTLQPDRAPEF